MLRDVLVIATDDELKKTLRHINTLMGALPTGSLLVTIYGAIMWEIKHELESRGIVIDD